MIKINKFTLSIVLSVIILFVACVYIYNFNKNNKKDLNNQIIKKTSTITFTSSPDKIDLYVNNKHYITPITLNLSEEDYVVNGAKDGYLTYTGEYVIKDTESHKYNIQLPIDPDSDQIDGDHTI